MKKFLILFLVLTLIFSSCGKQPSNNKTEESNHEIQKDSVVARALTLADNIESLPKTSSIANSNESGTSFKTLSKEEYSEIQNISSDKREVNSNYPLLDNIDGTIIDIKRWKDDLIETVIQLGVWILRGDNPNDDSLEKYRLSYDKNTDTAIIENFQWFSNQATYRYIESYYTETGKIGLKVKTFESWGAVIMIDYVEDTKWVAYCYEPIDSENSISKLIYANLASEKRETTAIEYVKHEFASYRTYVISNIGNLHISQSLSDVYQLEQGTYIQELFAQINNSSDQRVFETNYTDFIEISLYDLVGWDSIIQYTNPETSRKYIEVNVGDNIYVNFADFDEGYDQIYEEQGAHFQFVLGSIDNNPYLKIGYYESPYSCLEAIAVVFEKLGFDWKDSVKENALYFLENATQFVEERVAFDKVNFSSIAVEEYAKMFEDYQVESLDFSSFEKLKNEDTIYFEDQVLSSDRYEILTPTISGSANLTGEGILDFSGVTLSLEKSAFLSNGENYKVKIGHYNHNEFIELITSNSVTFDASSSNTLDFTFDNHQISPDIFSKAMSYENNLVALLFKEKNNEDIRMSGNVFVPYIGESYEEIRSEDVTYQDPTTGANVKITISYSFQLSSKDGKLVVKNQYSYQYNQKNS